MRVSPAKLGFFFSGAERIEGLATVEARDSEAGSKDVVESGDCLFFMINLLSAVLSLANMTSLRSPSGTISVSMDCWEEDIVAVVAVDYLEGVE